MNWAVVLAVAAAAEGCSSDEQRYGAAAEEIIIPSQPDYVDHVSGPNAIEGRLRNATVRITSGLDVCNGVLISPRHVLTAAHCVDDLPLEANQPVSVLISIGTAAEGPDGGVVGTWPWSTSVEATDTAHRRCWIHPSWNSVFNVGSATAPDDRCFRATWTSAINGGHDIALFELPEAVPRDIAIPLPVLREDTDGVGPLAPGMVFRVVSHTNPVIGRRYADLSLQPDFLFAAGVLQHGDSGGPVLLHRGELPNARRIGDPPARRYVAGVISTAAGRFTQVRSVLDFIDSHVAPGEPDPAHHWSAEMIGLTTLDNCPDVINPDQLDSDGDGRGDACDLCPATTIVAGDDPISLPQRNCNRAAEDLHSLPILGDACDPYPCATIAATNPSTERSPRRTCSRLGPDALICTEGDDRADLGYAPRSGVAPAALPPTSPPEGFTDAQTTVLRRCFCYRPDPLTNAPVPVFGQQCYDDPRSPCRRTSLPNGNNRGFGWIVADLEVPAPRAADPVIGTGAARNIAPRTGPIMAPRFNFPTFVGTNSARDSYESWFSLRGRRTWSWFNWDVHSAENPLPRTNVNSVEVPVAGPGTRALTQVAFWTRVQTDIAPPNANDPVQAVRDHYSTQPVSMRSTGPSMGRYVRSWYDWWWTRRVRFLRPDPDPPPFLERHHLVGRELLGVVTLGNDDAKEADADFWSNGDPTAPVRGVTFTRLNVRVATIVDSAATQGYPAALPKNADMAWTSTDANEEGWPVVYAFGGTRAGYSRNTLHRATPVLQPDGRYVYDWELIGASASPPARVRSAMVASADGKTLYLFGGRESDTGGVLSDLWAFDVASSTWTQRTLSATIPARYDTSIAVRGDELYIGGGIDPAGYAMSDLWRVHGPTGAAHNFGNVLPAGALADLAFDDHGDGLVYAGGYIGTTWYRDLWKVSIEGDTASTSFVHDFSGDGLGATENYAVVSDLEHNLFWAVPGYASSGNPQGTWLLDGALASSISQGGQGNNSPNLSLLRTTTAPTVSLARRPIGRRGSRSATLVRSGISAAPTTTTGVR